MYYGMLAAAAMMFSLQIFLNRAYERQCGNGMRAMIFFSAGTGAAGLIILLILNGFVLEFTWFTLIITAAASVIGLVFNFCSLKAFRQINLSLYSVLAMLGGMTIPFLFGLIFYAEALTFGKLLCLILITVALLMTVRQEKKAKGLKFYIGIFVLNGLSGVLAKLFQEAPWPKTSEMGYSILWAAISTVLPLFLLPFTREERLPINLRAVGSVIGFGILCRIGNLLMLLALAVLPASTQYPMITGGVMILSTLLSYFTPEKPSKRELAAVGISFAGILALVLIP